jgi:hypothetical protein
LPAKTLLLLLSIALIAATSFRSLDLDNKFCDAEREFECE